MSELEEYAHALPPIYQDVLSQFPISDPYRTPGSGLAVQTLYAGLIERYRGGQIDHPYSLGMVEEACLNMSQRGVVETRNRIFVFPQPLGEQLITILSGHIPQHVAPFPSPPVNS